MQRSLHLIVVMLAFARSFTLNPASSAARMSRSFSLGITPPTSIYLDSDRLSLTVTATSEMSFKGDLLVIPFYKPKVDKADSKDDKILLAELKMGIPSGLDADIQAIVADLLEEGIFKADVLSKQLVRLPSSVSGAKYDALVGLGANPKKGDATDLEISSASRLGKTVALIAKDVKAGITFVDERYFNLLYWTFFFVDTSGTYSCILIQILLCNESFVLLHFKNISRHLISRKGNFKST